MARPRKEIDREQFEKLCSLQCTQVEMAAYFDCSEDTIERWCEAEYGAGFAEVFKLKRGIGKISLRRSQFRMAETNPTMAIWLGKQYLGQTDKQDVQISTTSETIKEMDDYFAEQKRNSKFDME
jgi:hypothetical protein